MLLLAGCASSSPPPAPAASPAPPGALALIDQSAAATWTARIVGRDGKVIAEAAFPAPDRSPLGGGGVIAPIAAQTAAGALFFVGGDGVLRRLGRDGRATEVARLPATAGDRQVTTLGVAPDGATFAASVLTVAAGPTGHWKLDHYRGPTDGSTPKLLTTSDLGSQFPHPTMVVGWDAGGAVAALRLQLVASAPTLSTRFPDTVPIHLDERGQPSAPIGGPECTVALDETPAGVVLCTGDGKQLSVRSSDGTIRWQVTVSPPDQVGAPKRLAPDGSAVAGLGTAYRAAAAAALLPAGFVPAGWYDATTVVGSAPPDTAVKLQPITKGARAVALGAAGVYAGRL